MNHKCKCGSEQFIRRWVGVCIYTPCTIDMEDRTVRMDFSEEEQWDGKGAYTEFYCASCEARIPGRLQRKLRTEFEYE